MRRTNGPARILFGLAAALVLLSIGTASRADEVRFRAYDIVIDSGDRPLAAYQFELAYDRSSCSLVGVEGGPPPFARPPYYDPKGLTAGRIVVADFTTAPGAPRGKVRVARLHVEERGENPPGYRIRLVVAGTTGGSPISARIEMIPFEEGETR